ncbi:hypothetical protein [Actinoplanes sp. NPDC051851]|uniref:hypothetical protein n=1 Tax=Actinoplanes sp. NPDC051851 TaxID=3154753 RepID=UPI00342A5004
MGASGWDYYVTYQPDFGAAFADLQRRVFAEGDYYWADGREYGKSAAAFPDRPTSLDDLWGSETVQETGTHSILDMSRVIAPGEKPEFGTVEPLSDAEAVAHAGVAKLTRAHVAGLDGLVAERWLGRCAVLHDEAGEPSELYFWGISGD